jgi:hypothetical protein
MKKQERNMPQEEPMNDTYLWDGSGEPDPEVQRLETLLSQFRHIEDALVLPPQPQVQAGKLPTYIRQMPWIPRLAAAGIVLSALVTGVIVTFLPSSSFRSAPGWRVAPVAGTPQIGTIFITADRSNTKLQVGETLETNATSRASISQEDIGHVDIEPNSRVRVLQMDNQRKRIQLDVGTIHAAIWAPAGQFVVDTPSAVAVDLGCAYTLRVGPDGSGTIRTTLGWVGFQFNRRDSFIPAGAMCSTRPKIGPGTPYFEDASESFRDAVAKFDSISQAPEVREAALTTILAQARPSDSLTLWHLLPRTVGAGRERVFDRFAALVRPPRGVTRDGVLQLNQSMLDLWWNALGFGDISIWRYREQSSAPGATPQQQSLEKKQSLLKQAP